MKRNQRISTSELVEGKLHSFGATADEIFIISNRYKDPGALINLIDEAHISGVDEHAIVSALYIVDPKVVGSLSQKGSFWLKLKYLSVEYPEMVNEEAVNMSLSPVNIKEFVDMIEKYGVERVASFLTIEDALS